MAARRKPLKSPEPLEVILDRAGENRFARSRPPVAAQAWREAVGARIAERAVPLSVMDGVLLLRVPTSVWAHELSLLSEDVCVRLRQRGIAVQRLRFQVGALSPIDRPAERRIARSVPPPHERAELPVEVKAALAAVDDANLRTIVGLAAAANLAWQAVARGAPPVDITEARRAARAPRDAEAEIAPLDQTSPASRAERRGSREAEPNRYR